MVTEVRAAQDSVALIATYLEGVFTRLDAVADLIE